MSGKSTTRFESLEELARPRRVSPTPRRPLLLALCVIIATLTVYACNFYLTSPTSPDAHARVQRIPLNADHILRHCAALRATPGPGSDADFRLRRDASDRLEPGTRPTLIRDAHIWTGARNGTETVVGDVLLSGGVVKGIGYIPRRLLDDFTDLVTIDANGGWVTPGLVDLHSHVGVLSVPATRGTFDVNSAHGPVLPWLRSIDGFNTHDDAFELAIAGGVTSVQVLPGSGNAIGGQAFMIKLRKTSERSPTSMIIEPPHNLNGSEGDPDGPLRWRHMKQACGENLIRYGNRMDALWAYRSAYNEARKVKQLQDDFCYRAEAGLWDELTDKRFPDNLQWEMLVDVLRGRVKIANHCYEEVDLDDIVRLTNEFSFPIASFHHASEAWLVPDVLKRTWGGTPTVAIFASNHRYKRESYRGSPFAPRVLADNDIPVVMKSDHPVLNSRYLMYEAQQAHYYGLPPHLALASVTSAPARAAGLLHRIGMLVEGVDADVVLWDSHPLHLGATPRQVWIDGIPQLSVSGSPDSPGTAKPEKPGKVWQDVPRVPTWDAERAEAVEWEGLPPLGPKKTVAGKVVLKNVESVWVRTGEEGLKLHWRGRNEDEYGTVVLAGGRIFCAGNDRRCINAAEDVDKNGEDLVIDLHGGSVGPGLLTFGSSLGIEEIAGEVSTGDGVTFDPYLADLPNIMHDVGGVVRAADALQFGTRNALLAHRSGVTYATSSLLKTTLFGGPTNFIGGLSVTFRTGANHALESKALVKPITALHITIARTAPYRPVAPVVSVSTQIAVLRRLLLEGEDETTETGYWFKKAVEGTVPLIIEVGSADIMASLLQLKASIEDLRGGHIRMVFAGATEAHLIANEIAKAKVGVVLAPVRPFPANWDHRRMYVRQKLEGQEVHLQRQLADVAPVCRLAGPPITSTTAVEVLLKAGVTVALGVQDAWEVANMRWEAGWAAVDSNGSIDARHRYELVTTNLEKLMGIEGWIGDDGELVIYEGGDAFNMSSKVIAVAAPRRGLVEFF